MLAAIDGEEEVMRPEKKPVLKKVKKIKDTVKKKTHSQGNNRDEEEDEDEDEYDEEEYDPEVHGAGLKDNLEVCAGGFEEDPAAPASSEASRERSRAGEEIGMSPVIRSFVAMSVENPAAAKNADEEKSDRVSATTKTAYEKVAGEGSAAAEKAVGRLGGGMGVMLVEKLKPGEEDKALSEVISGAFQRRKTAAGATVVAASSGAKGSGVGVVGRLREAMASWAGGRRSSMREQKSKGNKSVS